MCRCAAADRERRKFDCSETWEFRRNVILRFESEGLVWELFAVSHMARLAASLQCLYWFLSAVKIIGLSELNDCGCRLLLLLRHLDGVGGVLRHKIRLRLAEQFL